MTQDEFSTWLNEYKAAFPQAGKWIDELPAKRATLALWFETTFVNLELADCLAATRRMVTGDDDPVLAFDRDSTAQIVAGYANDARNRRLGGSTSKFVPEYVEAANGKKKFDILGICSRIKDAMRGGLTSQQACDKHLPPTDPEDSPRYRCLYCRDTGFTNVWHVTAMHAAKLGKFNKTRHTSICVIRCCCKAGNKYPGFELMFDPEKWLHCANYNSDEEIAKLHSFMKSYGVKTDDWDQWQPQNQEAF